MVLPSNSETQPGPDWAEADWNVVKPKISNPIASVTQRFIVTSSRWLFDCQPG
jgi:hypothetical protein